MIYHEVGFEKETFLETMGLYSVYSSKKRVPMVTLANDAYAINPFKMDCLPRGGRGTSGSG